MIHMARDKNIKPVLINAFQTGLALSMIALFAARMDLSDTAAGLDPLGNFKTDLLSGGGFPIVKGEIDLAEVFKCFNRINTNILKDL